MTGEIEQWQRQINQLQQQLAIARRDCEVARQREANWRQLYEIEAQQRRAAAANAQTTITNLNSEIQQLQQPQLPGSLTPETLKALQQELEALPTTLPELQAKLAELLRERQQLLQALRIEQTNHARTRQTLTTALGDAISALSRNRGRRNGRSPQKPST